MEALYVFAAPTCNRQDYIVEVDVRWQGNSGASYGLIFGIVGDYDQFYSFEVNADFQDFALYRYDASGWSALVPIRYAPAIQYGTATNHLKVARNGSAITLEVNGSTLGTWFDSNIWGATGAGLIVSSYSDLPNADARLDNFKVIGTTAVGSSSATTAPGPAVTVGPELSPVNGALDRWTSKAGFRRILSKDGWR